MLGWMLRQMLYLAALGGLLVFLTQGLGMFFGFRMAFGGNWPFTTIPLPNTLGGFVAAPANHAALMENIKTATGNKPDPTFLESMAGMFGMGYPDGVDQALISKAMIDWKNFWLFPAGMAAVIVVIFLRSQVSLLWLLIGGMLGIARI